MQVINLFEVHANPSGLDARTARGVCASQRLYQVVRHGAHMHPTLIWLDAGLAVLDAFAAYTRYRQASEITQALEAECQALRHLLDNELTIMGLQRDTLQHEQARREQILTMHIEHNREAARQMLERLVTQRALIERLLTELNVLRGTQGASVNAFLALESAVHQLMRAHLIGLLDQLG